MQNRLATRKSIESFMAFELFLDSGGFYSLLVLSDPQHHAANQILRTAKADKRRLVTTDYVLDETATLFKARGQMRLVYTLFESVLSSKACHIAWTDETRFSTARTLFSKHADQAWSFTDCVSFCTMKELRLQEALTADHHFEQAGFIALLK